MGTGHLYLNRVLSVAGAGDQANSRVPRLALGHLKWSSWAAKAPRRRCPRKAARPEYGQIA